MNNIKKLLAAALVAFPTVAFAQAPAPRSYAASPDAYKVIAESDKFVVIAVTWKPGYRDTFHSHGEQVAAYNLTDCTTRVHTPDGKFTEGTQKAGAARVRAQPPAHSIENIGKEECRLILFEPK